MEHLSAEYQGFHFHLLYDAALAVISFVIVLRIGRLLALHDSGLRARLFALAIGMPVLGELIAFAAFKMRPAPYTPLGQAMSSFHEQCGFCTLMDEPLILSTQPHWVLFALLLVALLSLAKNGLGAFVLSRLAARYPAFPFDDHPGLRARLIRIATKHGVPMAAITVSPHSIPLALTFGVRQPAILVSRGMLSCFSRAELETVLTHELAHTIRRDNLWKYLITILRDALFFLPTSHLAWRLMLTSQEEACDDLSVRWTGRPLDLARSLVKTWQHPRPRDLALLAGLFLTTPFFRHATSVEWRVERIIRVHQQAGAFPPSGGRRLATAVLGLTLLMHALPIALGS